MRRLKAAARGLVLAAPFLALLLSFGLLRELPLWMAIVVILGLAGGCFASYRLQGVRSD